MSATDTANTASLKEAFKLFVSASHWASLLGEALGTQPHADMQLG